MQGQRPGLGVLLALMVAAAFAGLDTSVRYLGGTVPVMVMLAARYGLQAGLMAAFLALVKGQRFASAHPRFQMLRGVLLLTCSALTFVGLQHMPVPEFTAVALLSPLFVTLLAALVLRERVSGVRWLLVVGGFSGALVVIRPGSGLFGWTVLFPLANALSYAAFQVLTARLAALENPFTTHFWTGLVGLAVVLPVVLAISAVGSTDLAGTLSGLKPGQWTLLLVIGLLGTAGHLLLILALGMAPASTLMPFGYSQLAWAALLSWLVFRQWPDGWSWAGMAIIAACGAAGAWLNVRAAQARRRPVTALAADTVAE